MSTTLETYILRFGATDKATFMAEVRCPVLVDSAYSIGSIAPKQGFRTATIDDARALPYRTKANEREVLLIKKRQEATFLGHVSVGRASNLDVVISRTGISKFHAYFSEVEAGFQLTDKDSTNGTWVAGDRLLPAAPILLPNKVDLQFANHGFTFMMPDRFFELLRSSIS